MLPFDDENLIPKAKTHISLDLIENVIVDDDSLIINFKPERKEPKWVLICFAKNVAEELKKIIDDAFHER